MTLLNDAEKVNSLIHILDRHIKKIPTEGTFAYYLESLCIFLKTKDAILRKEAIYNSELFIDTISHVLRKQLTYKHVIGSLIAAFDKVGYSDSMDAAAIIIEFEQFLKQMPSEEAENVYKERWGES
ncbi:hypothetical protein [Paenibacillus sp. FJAT-26967]|uniref:hypothetical protein n=1 Tax=Paenibacillus sp. FJAT-26967 TaxID=1729690 RepID=UPI00083917B2|nr:hypothetical protein [Paenibacillus sp. FJAT-26967]